MTTEDTKKLIDYSVSFAEKLLTDYQEFYPFASTINLSGELVQVEYFDGDDHPLSQDLINKIQPILDQKIDSKEMRAYALTYDVRVKRDHLSDKTDAIAIKIKHRDLNDILVHYFAYRLTPQKTFEHLDSWTEIIT